MKSRFIVAILVTIVFAFLFIFLISTSESQKNNILNGGSFIGPVVYILFTPGALVDLFIAPASCRDQVSSFQSYLNCPYLHYVELIISYIIYLGIVMIIAWAYNKIKQRKE